mmetsp:Transcript_18934/g.52140  ORF Transcript_18934/g.52140 Transcript_18934/m.52140 type:complete len:255 (+) Transcript_18934:2494-3258(+)
MGLRQCRFERSVIRHRPRYPYNSAKQAHQQESVHCGSVEVSLVRLFSGEQLQHQHALLEHRVLGVGRASLPHEAGICTRESAEPKDAEGARKCREYQRYRRVRLREETARRKEEKACSGDKHLPHQLRHGPCWCQIPRWQEEVEEVQHQAYGGDGPGTVHRVALPLLQKPHALAAAAHTRPEAHASSREAGSDGEACYEVQREAQSFAAAPPGVVSHEVWVLRGKGVISASSGWDGNFGHSIRRFATEFVEWAL